MHVVLNRVFFWLLKFAPFLITKVWLFASLLLRLLPSLSNGFSVFFSLIYRNSLYILETSSWLVISILAGSITCPLQRKPHATNLNSSHFCFGHSVTHPILSTVSTDAHKHVLFYIPSVRCRYPWGMALSADTAILTQSLHSSLGLHTGINIAPRLI